MTNCNSYIALLTIKNRSSFLFRKFLSVSTPFLFANITGASQKVKSPGYILK